jgi:hypothetical protein
MRQLIAITLVLISNAVNAEQWVVLRESPEGGTSPPGMLVDSTSITILESGVRRARVKVDSLSRRTDRENLGPTAVSYMIFVNLYDCEKQLTRNESMEAHLNDGSSQAAVLSKDRKWYPAPENRAADPTFDFVCGWKPK